MIYVVTTERFGRVLLERDNIKVARRWAKEALPGLATDVRRESNYRVCETCDSAPCTCRRPS